MSHEEYEEVKNTIFKEITGLELKDQYQLEKLIWDWNWSWDNSAPAEVCKIGKFRTRQGDDIDNFVYDRKLELVFINFEAGNHQMFIRSLEQLYQNKTEERANKEFHDSEVKGHWLDFTERYLQNGRGFYQSSQEGYIFKDKNMALNPQERMVFRGYSFHRIENN